MKIPKYRRFTARNLGFVEVSGKKKYFPGKYNSPESLAAYADFIKAMAAKPEEVEEVRLSVDNTIPISFLVLRFLDWAKGRYIKNGRSTGTYEKACHITTTLTDLYGEMPTTQFGPLALKKVRERFLAANLCRNEVNDRVSRIKRIFSWGVENELVPASVADALKYVSGLREGETKARETAPVAAVSDSAIDAILPFLPPTVDDMVRIHRLIGGRPSEICNLRWCDIDQSDDIWIYTPWEHKTEHHKKPKYIPIPPDAQIILEKYRHRPPEEFIFSPRETVRIVAERKRAARKTPVQPSQVKRAAKAANNPKAKHGDRYSTRAYERAIDRACDRAEIPRWSPNQIRHRVATEARKNLGAEAAQLLLGHAQLSTTEIYAEKSLEKIKEVARSLYAPKTAKLYIDVEPIDMQQAVDKLPAF